MTHTQSIVANLKNCNAEIPSRIQTAANVDRITEGWMLEEYQATYQAGELSEIDAATATEAGVSHSDVMARVTSWADDYSQKIVNRMGAAEAIRALVALHEPACTDAGLREIVKKHLR